MTTCCIKMCAVIPLQGPILRARDDVMVTTLQQAKQKDAHQRVTAKLNSAPVQAYYVYAYFLGVTTQCMYELSSDSPSKSEPIPDGPSSRRIKCLGKIRFSSLSSCLVLSLEFMHESTLVPSRNTTVTTLPSGAVHLEVLDDRTHMVQVY